MNFDYGSSLFGNLLGQNSSSGGVNTQVLYTYTLKAHPNSSSFVTYLPPKSSSENRQNVASNQASSGQSSGSGKRGRRCAACKAYGHYRSSKKCPQYGQDATHTVIAGGGPSAGGSEDADEDQGDDGYDDGENERTYVEEDGDSSEGSYYNSDKDSELLEDGDLHGIGTDESSDDDSYEENSVPNSSNQVMVIPELEPLDKLKWEEEAILPTVRADTRTQRREDLRQGCPRFRIADPGPKLKGGDKKNRDLSPLSFLKLFWDTTIVGTFLEVMNVFKNRRNQKRRSTDWTADDFWAFLGLILYFGVVKYPQRGMPWQDDPMLSDEFVQSVMSHRQFDTMVNCFRYTDTTRLTERERKEKNREDGFWTVQSFLTRISDNFLKQYKPYQDLSIDEICFPYKGRHRYRQYNKDKPHPYHFAFFGLCCPVTSYLLSFIPSRGRDQKRDSRVSASEWPVLQLLNRSEFHHLGLVATTDNFYTGITLMTILLHWGVYLLGTVRANRKGIPKDKLFPKVGADKRERGEAECWYTTVSVLGLLRKIYLICWQDNKPVHMLSSMETTMSEVMRVHKRERRYTHKETIPMPASIKYYNGSMGGADMHGQYVQYYRTTIKTVAWQPRIFTQCLHSAVNNAHVMYKRYYKLERGDDGYSFLSFITLLIKEMCGLDSKNGQEKAAVSPPMCLPVYYKRDSKAKKDERQQCVHCKDKKSVVKCNGCGVALCVGTVGDTKKSCWELFHEAKLA